MKLFATASALVASSLLYAFYAGSLPERRYEGDACQYRMIYGQEPGQQAGLLTLGGSRVRVATSARHFDEIVGRMKPDALPVYNLSHSIYGLEKEYILLRDFLQRHRLKTALVMIEPRGSDFGAIKESSTEIARLTDMPTLVGNLWPEDKMQSVLAVRDVVVQHLKFTDKAGKPHKDFTLQDCDRFDYRLDIEKLNAAKSVYDRIAEKSFDWDLSSEREEGFLRWMASFRELKEEHDIELFFLLMTATSEPLPPRGFDETFERITGNKLITLEQDIHDRLVEMGKRDSSHLNRIGREMFLPWLVQKIDEKCERTDGCF